ncbi:MAG: large conductance mechanosensitive channel protein MscL [Chloroflexi bacterium]|nr:large conductance mechanosensitive channel protein MscL [Chloroflexota bacterium]
MLKEFRDFINKGNVIDLAVAVIIGAAFSAIVTSLVADIITPLLLNPAMRAAHVNDLAQLSSNGIKYGSFLAAVLNFLVVSFVIFLLVRSINHMTKPLVAPPEPPPPPADVLLLTEIRDLLRNGYPSAQSRPPLERDTP